MSRPRQNFVGHQWLLCCCTRQFKHEGDCSWVIDCSWGIVVLFPDDFSLSEMKSLACEIRGLIITGGLIIAG